MTAGSLFSGIGGFDRGFFLAGIEPQWACEIEPSCRRILRRHFPEVPVFEDVRECGAHNLSPVDVISFGSPCQDLSIAGKRDGLEGKRSSLFYEAIRICRELRPAFAVWENVPGALSSNDGRDFAAILAAFRECGARDLCWRVLDSRYFGVAQRRRRVFVVADFRGERAGEVLFESESLRGNPEASDSAGEDLAGTLGSSPTGGFGKLDTCGAFIPVAAPLTAPCGKGGFTDPVNDNVLAIGVSNDPTPKIGLDIMPPLQSKHGLGGGGGRMECVAFTERTRQDGRNLETSDLAYALTNPGSGGRTHSRQILHGMSVRRLTPVECERLQGFEDGWTAGESDSARYRALGNAVTVPVSRWIGRRIMEAAR